MRILLDAMLGGLRSYLRICGHDAAYALDRGIEADDELLAWAEAEDRTLVTRDAALAGRAEESVVVESHDVEEQLREVRTAGVRLTLADPPERCGRCNGPLVAAAGGEAPAYVPDDVVDRWRCRDCGQYFWKGSHWEDVRDRLAAL
jgi:uncharacterized protein with PIN domain